MTLGERIAYLRKEKNLSQEGLGDLVGVSRQAVSKWEADRALPDVHNCVAMSQALGVTLAELLELEEGKGADKGSAEVYVLEDGEAVGDSKDKDVHDACADSEGLTSAQIRIVEKMVEKYTAAQKRLRLRMRWPLIIVGCLCIVGVAWLWQWLTDMNRTIDYLHGEVAGLRGEIISGVSDQLQASLKEERSLVTNYGWEIVSADLRTNTITYEVTVNLKEKSANTSVKLLVRCEEDTLISEMSSLGGLGYEGQITCPIVDGTALYLLLENEEQSSNELLLEVHPESWYTLQIWNQGSTGNLKNMGVVTGATEILNFGMDFEAAPGLPEPIGITRLEVVVLCNDKIVATQPEDMTYAKPGEPGQAWGISKQVKIPIITGMAAEGDRLTFELRLWDSYDRYFSRVLSQYWIQNDGTLIEDYEVLYDSVP